MTPALPAGAVEAALRPVYGAILHHRLPFRAQRVLLDAVSLSQPVPRGPRRRRLVLGGRPCEAWVPAAARTPPAAVLYLHGGGFVAGSPRTHRPLTARLARDTGATVYALDYRLAPEHPYPAAVDDAEAAFAELVGARGLPAASVAVAGDSAGGGIAAALTGRIIDAGSAPPAALVLIAPAVDPGADPADLREDAVLRRGWIAAACGAYRGATDRADPGFAPLHAPVDGFPPTSIHVGAREMLRPQAEAYADRLREAGVDVGLTVEPDLWHVAQLQAGLVREAARSADRIAAFVRERLA